MVDSKTVTPHAPPKEYIEIIHYASFGHKKGGFYIMREIQLSESDLQALKNEIRQSVVEEMRQRKVTVSHRQESPLNELKKKHRRELQEATGCGMAWDHLQKDALFLNGYAQRRLVFAEEEQAVCETAEQLIDKTLEKFKERKEEKLYGKHG